MNQYWLPGLENAERGEPPHFELEYTTFGRKGLEPRQGEGEDKEAAAPIPLKELPKTLRNAVGGMAEGKKWKKYVPYGMDDLTIKRWLKLGRILGQKESEEVRAVFRRFMYQGADV